MPDRLIGRLQILAASVVVLVTITFQALASFQIQFGPIEGSPFLWPFLDYPMYTGAHYAGEPLERQVVVGILADSSEVMIAPADLGVTFWQFQNFLNPAILDGHRDRADVYRGIYEERYGEYLIGFRLEDHPLILTEEGLVEGEPVELGALFFDSRERP